MVKGNKISERTKRGKKTLTVEQIIEKYEKYLSNVFDQNELILKANEILPTNKQVKSITVLNIDAWKKYKPTGETKDQKIYRINEKRENKANALEIKINAKEQKKQAKISKFQEKIDKLKHDLVL